MSRLSRRRVQGASVATLSIVIAISALRAAPDLPACHAASVVDRLPQAIGAVPALSDTDVRLLEVDAIRSRGHAGKTSLRACQAWIRTTAGDGPLEYSIRDRTHPGATFEVRAELFRGRWHRHPREINTAGTS